jgi:hypothetical protein
VSTKEAAELPLADLKSFGQRRDVAAVEGSAFDELQRPRDRRRRPAPCVKVRRTFRSASQARSKAGLLCGGGGGEEMAILELGWSRGADRPAIDAGRLYAGEESPVVAGITRQHGSVTN